MTATGALGSAPGGPEVRVVGGRLRGGREPGVAVFRGIPFAEPPVGELRFAAPRRASSWDGVRPALSFGPPVPQTGLIGPDLSSRQAPTLMRAIPLRPVGNRAACQANKRSLVSGWS